jgi:hypothetical protein
MPLPPISVTAARLPMINMMATMFDFMEWFLGGRDSLLNADSLPSRYGYPVSSWYPPYNAIR